MVSSLCGGPEFLGADALQAFHISQVFILESCPKGQNWRYRMGVAVSDTIRHNDSLGFQPLLLEEKGRGTTPGV